MTKSNIIELVEKFSQSLEDLDIHVMETTPFIYDSGEGKSYTDAEDLRKDIVAGKVSMFFTVEAILGPSVWSFLDEQEED